MQILRYTPNEFEIYETRELFVSGKAMKYTHFCLTNKRIILKEYLGKNNLNEYMSIPLDTILTENGKVCMEYTQIEKLTGRNTVVIQTKDRPLTLQNGKFKADSLFIVMDLINYLVSGYISNFSNVDAVATMENLEAAAYSPVSPFTFA